jgi:hypothetical protein
MADQGKQPSADSTQNGTSKQEDECIIQVSRETYRKLQRVAERRGIPIAQLMAEIVDAALKRAQGKLD